MLWSLGWVWYCLTSTLSDPCGWLAPLQWPRVYLCMADWYVGWVSGAWPLCLSNLYKFILHSACTTNIIILIINNTPATIISCVWGRGRNWRHWHPLLIRTQSHIWSGLILDQVVWLSPEYVAAKFFSFLIFIGIPCHPAMITVIFCMQSIWPQWGRPDRHHLDTQHQIWSVWSAQKSTIVKYPHHVDSTKTHTVTQPSLVIAF